MKLKDILSKYQEWHFLTNSVLTLWRNAKNCKDAALLTIAEQMLCLIVALAGKEVDLREL